MLEILFYVGVPYLLIGLLFTTAVVLPITNGQAPWIEYAKATIFWPKLVWDCYWGE